MTEEGAEPKVKDRRAKARTRVERTMDNLLDLSESERNQILDRLIDDQMDAEEDAKVRAKLVDPTDYADEALDRMKNWGKVVGISSGYYDLDKMTCGFAPGELTIVAGETSQGKTLLCCNIAANMLRKNHKIVFVTLEMTKAELLSRFWKILGYGTDGDGCTQLMSTVGQNMRFQEVDRMDWKTIPYLIEQAKEWGAECVFIDHLHYFARDMHDMANELGIITQEFKQSAIKHNIPIVLVSHTRKVEKGKKHADLNDLRGSSYIAQDADIVLMVWQDKDNPDTITIGLDKNRNRLDYRVGTAVEHKKEGLIIQDVGVLERASLDRNSVNYTEGSRPITAMYPTAAEQHIPQGDDTPPWEEPVKLQIDDNKTEQSNGGIIKW